MQTIKIQYRRGAIYVTAYIACRSKWVHAYGDMDKVKEKGVDKTPITIECFTYAKKMLKKIVQSKQHFVSQVKGN